jgi:hypothetical protein
MSNLKNIILIFCLLPPLVVNSETIGILNNNPGNLSSRNFKAWQGAIGYDGWQHLRFGNSVQGIVAIGTNLRLYKEKHGIRTVTGLVSRWIPKKDTSRQHREYVQCVCSRLGGIDPFKKLDFADPCIQKKLAKAIIFYENGHDPYSEKTYALAFGGCFN